ncbi:cytochrome P450 6k1-like [Tenebrio molitor]|uniref:cytochrome P450 6k1-like n=1 Tax=Tenebrio molitor TaxID=7067 RepID=UPI00362485D4
MLLLMLIILAISIVYYFVHLKYQYWTKRGVVGPRPKFFVGNLGGCLLLKTSPGDLYSNIYKEYHHKSIVGLYRSFTPMLLIRDPELIKEVTTKSFSHFHDNDIDIDKDANLIFAKNPFTLKGEEWKVVRAQLTPCFTSGKMKWLYPYLEENSAQLVQFVQSLPEATNGKGYEAKELATRFTLNNVGDCVFGVKAKCFEEENSEFRQLAREFLTPGSWSILAIFVATIFPVVMKIFPIRFASKAVENKLLEIVSDTLSYREGKKIIRNDFLHILSQLKKTSKDYEFTDVDVTAHAAGFFADGYETSSIVMSFVLFELSVNPEAQSKLREEINKAFEENDHKLPYEVLKALPYLDGVINETLRIHPPALSLQKLCTEAFTYTPKETNRSMVIEKDTPIILPVSGLHKDPQYFESPESFKPERFVGENKETIKKGTFLPFGEGPRACLGQRFGLLQIKVGVSYVVNNFELSVNKRTKLPLQYDPTYFLTSPIGGMWIDYKKIR